MAVKQRRNIKKQNETENYFNISSEKKRKIIGILYILFGVFLLLSIVSFDKRDEANLTGFFSTCDRCEIYNWGGIIGANFATFFVKSTIGYFSVAFPILLFVWGASFIKPVTSRLLIHISNFTLLSGIIIASIFGVLQIYFGILSIELYGLVGKYVGGRLSNLFGGAVSILLLISTLIVMLIFAFDIKIERIFSFIKDVFQPIGRRDNTTIRIKDGDGANLDKIKKLRPGKKSKKEKETTVTAEDLMFDEEEQTNIRIIRKDDKPTRQPDSSILENERKKVDLEKTGELEKKDIDSDKEDELPDPWEEKINFQMVGQDLLDESPQEDIKVAEEELTRNAELLKEKLKLFDIDIKDISVTPGPVVTLYEIVPAPGVKISKIVSLENDIALALAARGIRIIAPIPGKGAIGVEIPNAKASLVNARSVLSKIHESDAELPIALGKTISGDVVVADLSQMPHLLIAGSTGSGKSVGINMIISSLLFTKHPSEVKFALIDPKKIELSFYNKLRRHYLAVSPDLDEEIITVPQNAVIVLKSIEHEMEKRYDKLAKAGVRNIVDYNKKVSNPKTKPPDTELIKHHQIPYLIVIVDELADLMISAGKEVEEPITRLAQLARAVGIHLILATQRPSVNVITGVIKANFSARVAYQVATKIDSRTILDMNGAEQLLGNGDMLFLPTGSPKPSRIQNAFISTDEVERLTGFIYPQQAYSKPYYLPSVYEKKRSKSRGHGADFDPMFEDAARVIVRHQQGSVSLLQRRLKLGYSRAARIVDQLEEAGIVGPNDGSKARQVLIENDMQLETLLRTL
ncbi:MAG: DNA translocase FtsK 4TM domain-containing protein [Ignavibacteria bacterium]|jgi:S-DNA-T family DNA segregation ATPase FtsK/SpoIIIE